MDALTRAGYVAHAESPAFLRRLTEARHIIARHADYSVSVSWGKDSIALLAVAAATLVRVIAIHGRYRVAAENAGDIDAVRDAVLARPDMINVDYREIEIPGEWDLFERAGGPFVQPCADHHFEALRWRRAIARGRLREACEGAGCRRYMLGLRAAESGARRVNIATRGLAYEKRDGQSIALPIGRWEADDVWALLTARELPWLRIYDIAPNRDRARSMLCIALGSSDRHLRDGEYELWRRCYPDEIAQWEARWPQLRHLVNSNVGALA